MAQSRVSETIVISGTGMFTPPESISNAELVESFNQYVELYNEQNKADIESGKLVALSGSTEEFIVKASGIKNRYVMNKSGVLDINRMTPDIPERTDDQMSIQCEIAVAAAKQAMENAHKKPEDIDGVIVACSIFQRAYPAVSIEVQQALGIEGFAFDMNVACSSATFAIQNAKDSINAGSARSILVISPEICSGHLPWEERDSHFIFGDIATALVLEKAEAATSDNQWLIMDSQLKTAFSNNIRNNFGFLNRCEGPDANTNDKLFYQNGRKVFKEVVSIVSTLILGHLSKNSIEVADLRRMWLHQANINMNKLIAKKVLGHAASNDAAPVVLDEYANTGCAGSIIAFHKYSQDLEIGDVGLICSFGAGYSAGSILVKKQ